VKENEISRYEQSLPSTIEDLAPYVLIGEEKIKAYRAKLSAVKKLSLSIECERAALDDAQRMGEAVIMAKSKVGELLASRPRNYQSSGRGTLKEERLPNGISRKTSHQAQTLANNPDRVRQFIADAKESDKIPTPDVIYKLIKTEEKRGNVLQTSGETSPACAISDLQSLVDAGRKYKTILADPPWSYSNQGTRAATGNHYNTMSIDDICALPISRLADETAHLHLWTTNAFLFDCKKIMELWGFEYKSCFVWVKSSMGIGNYWRVSHEFMLLGVRGSLPFQNHSEMSWYEEKRSKHSAKPLEVIKKIETVSPGPYLELFGRETRENWTVWGNQISKTLFNEAAFG
jgi:N6-adenosine-specific RNA methylase IME4